MGWDWVTYYGETQGVDADFNFTLLQRPDVTAVRDRFDQLEGLSGGAGDDILRGPNRAVEGEFAGDEEYLHKMTESTLDLVGGLREMLYPEGMNFGQQFMRTGPVIDSDGFPSIIIGGQGSDLIEGRYGNDYLDGDAYLAADLAWVGPDGSIIEQHPSAAPYRARLLNGTINPGDLEIVREIRYDDPGSSAVDTALYQDIRSAYEITHIRDGYWQIEHTGAVEAEESEGIDILNNIEILQFQDNCVLLDPEAQTVLDCISEGELVLTTTPDMLEGEPVVAELLDLSGEPFDLTEASNIRFFWIGGEGSSPTEITEREELTIGGVAPDTDAPNRSTFIPNDDAVDMYLIARVTFELGGTTHTVVSAPTGSTVVNVNDEPVPPDLAGNLEVGSTLSVTVPTDEDGTEDVVFTYTWQRALAADAPEDDWTVIQGPGSDPLQDSAYLLVDGDLDGFIRVVIEYTDNQGQDERAVTQARGPVTAVP